MRRLAILFLFVGSAASPQDTQTATKTQEFGLKTRFRWYLKRTYIDPRSHANLIADVTADDFIFGGLKRWGSGLSGWGRSLTPAYGERVIDNTTEFLVGAFVGDDARYRPMQNGSLVGRGFHATEGAFTARGKNGRTQLAYSRIAAVATSILIANQWHPHPATGNNLSRTVVFGITDKVQGDLLQEFSPDLTRIGRGIWRKIRHDHKGISR